MKSLTPNPFRPQEKVLHNIMPIFTFMGANIMRLDDSYSFQVINKTVQTVIPALIKVSAGLGLMTRGSSTRLGIPIAKARELVPCFGGVALEGGWWLVSPKLPFAAFITR